MVWDGKPSAAGRAVRTAARAGSWAWALVLAALVGCTSYGVHELKHERLDPITGARLELFVAKHACIDARPIDRKTLKVLTPEGQRFIFVESRERDATTSRLQVNRDARQTDAGPEDWALYRSYMQHFDEPAYKEGPVQTRRAVR